MEQLLSMLKSIPEYNGILAAMAEGTPAAVTGICLLYTSDAADE